jgi:hypothetical protein
VLTLQGLRNPNAGLKSTNHAAADVRSGHVMSRSGAVIGRAFRGSLFFLQRLCFETRGCVKGVKLLPMLPVDPKRACDSQIRGVPGVEAVQRIVDGGSVVCERRCSVHKRTTGQGETPQNGAQLLQATRNACYTCGYAPSACHDAVRAERVIVTQENVPTRSSLSRRSARTFPACHIRPPA